MLRPSALAALQAAVPGGVRSRLIDRVALSHDASHYLLTPEVVVRPSSTEQIAALLRVAGSHRLPVTFRSGGTSLSGQAVSDSVLLDTRGGFLGVEVLDGGRRVRVRPGVTVRAVNSHLAAYGYRLGPDPASEAACTMGGVIADNSSGMTCGTRYNAYRTVESMILVLPSGTVLDTADAGADRLLAECEPALHAGLLALRERIRRRPESVAEVGRQFAIKNTMGYGLNSFLDHDLPSEILAHLVVGSEGTLAFVAEATLRTVPIRAHAATALLIFDSMPAATAVLPELIGAGFDAIELMDATSLRVARGDAAVPAVLAGLMVERHAAFLVEMQRESEEELREARRHGDAILAGLPSTMPVTLSSVAATRTALWHIRKGLYAAVAGARPAGTTALLEDVAVPTPVLAETCRHLDELFHRHGYHDSVIFGHAKDGNLHFLLNERFETAGAAERYGAFTEELVEAILGRGGTLKAEHGTGRMMAPFVRRQYGDELYEVMREVKRLCDPHGILNPGVLIGDDPAAHLRELKVTPAVDPEIDRCVECGYCEPVCPSRALTLTPRQRIVVRRAVGEALGRGDTREAAELERDFDYDGVQTCAADGLCQLACPVDIDTGALVKRLRSERQGRLARRTGALAADHWQAAVWGAGRLVQLGHRIPDPVTRAATVAGRAVLGAEVVPSWDPGLPGAGSRRVPRAVPDPAAVFFQACIGSIFGPEREGLTVAEAFLRLCERAGMAVAVPDGIAALCCGTPWQSKGLSDGYAAMRARTGAALRAVTGRGRLPVVCDASSCTEGLRQTVAELERDGIAITVLDTVEFVADRLMPHLTVPNPLTSLLIHPTCSSARLGIDQAVRALAGRIATEVSVPTDWGCCAFAGDRGLLHPELTASATTSEAAEIAGGTFAAYASLNRTCELGMTRATGRPFRHLLQLVEELTRPAPEG